MCLLTVNDFVTTAAMALKHEAIDFYVRDEVRPRALGPSQYAADKDNSGNQYSPSGS